MKWDELPLMMVRDRDNEQWHGPLNAIQTESVFLSFSENGHTCWRQAKPYTEPQPPKMRPMTRDEVLAWACSEQALGWVVRLRYYQPECPQNWSYNEGYIAAYTRSRASVTGDYKWEKFEVEVHDEQA